MPLLRHLQLIPSTLVLGLSLLAISPAQSGGTEEPAASETISAQDRLKNHLQTVLSYYQSMESQLSKASTQTEAKDIWDATLRQIPQNLLNGFFISDGLQNIPLKEQKRILASYKDQMQSLRNNLPIQLQRLGFDPQSVSYDMYRMEALHEFFKAWEHLVQQYPEASDADEIFQQYLTRLAHGHQLLASIRTPNDRQRIEEIINDRSKPYNPQDDIWINELQDILKKLPLETQKRLYIQYLHHTRTILPCTPEKASGQYHYLVYQSEPLLQYLSRRFEEFYTLQKTWESLENQSPDNFPTDMSEKEILIQQNYILTKQLNNLLSKATGKAAAAAVGPRAFDLKNRLRETKELLICSDDVSPEEQIRLHQQYDPLMQQADAELNVQLQRLSSKNSYRNNFLSWVVDDLSPKQNSEPRKNEPVSSEQTQEPSPEPNEN